MNELPVDAVREEFLEAAAVARPVVVVAPTGSGKSTRLPLWLCERADKPVLVVEPRRVACRSLSGYLATQTDVSVGHRVRFDDTAGPDTKLWFVTPGVALNLVADGSADDFGAVVIDEFHERSWEIDLLLALFRDRVGTQSLVLCSATLDAQAVAGALDASVIRSEGRSYPIEIEYAGEGGPSTRDLADRVAAAVERAWKSESGDILVFLPGKGEIARCADAIGRTDSVQALHGGVAPDVMARACQASRERRILLSTNVAETSVTIPGVRTVIDSGLVRMRIHQARRSLLAVVPTSQASMDQRAGRAGRTAPGRCIRLWDARFAAPEHTAPEILRCELDDLVVRAVSCNVRADSIESLPWLEPLPQFALDEARDRLVAAGTLDPSCRLTDAGRDRMRFPVSPRAARLLADAPAPLAADLADLAAVMEVGRDLVQGRGGDPRARAELFEGAAHEVDVQLLALRRGSIGRHGLAAAALKEARKLAKALRRSIGVDEPFDARGRAEPDLAAFVVRRLPDAVFVLRRSGKRGSDAWSNGEVEVSLRRYEVPDLEMDEQPKPPVAGVLLDQEWLGIGRSARGVGRLLLPASPDELVRAGIGEVAVAEPTLRKRPRARPLIVAATEHRYAEVVLASQQAEVSGPALARACGMLAAQNRLWKGISDPLLDALHLRDLIRQAAGESAQPLPGVAETVESVLREGGIEDQEELVLVDAQDLMPNNEALAQRLGVAPDEVAKLEADFPRIWKSPTGRYAVRVWLERRRVELQPIDKGLKEPKTNLIPRFRNFRVGYRKASRKVSLR